MYIGVGKGSILVTVVLLLCDIVTQPKVIGGHSLFSYT